MKALDPSLIILKYDHDTDRWKEHRSFECDGKIPVDRLRKYGLRFLKETRLSNSTTYYLGCLGIRHGFAVVNDDSCRNAFVIVNKGIVMFAYSTNMDLHK